MITFKSSGVCGPDASRLEVMSPEMHKLAFDIKGQYAYRPVLNLEQITFLHKKLGEFLKKHSQPNPKESLIVGDEF